MNLVIDIGNTLQKIALFSEGCSAPIVYSFPKIDLIILEKLFSQYKIEKSIISSVASCDPQVEAYLAKHSHWIAFSVKSNLPIKIDYETPETLGLDRIANAVGAATLFPNENVLSIQAGTCLVADFVSADGTYKGGSISPGLFMRFRALHHFTQRLPQESFSELEDNIGRNTQTSIQIGVIKGVIYEIEGIINSYENRYKGLKTILTGGDLEHLQKSIKNTIFAAPNLVLWGLNKILEING